MPCANPLQKFSRAKLVLLVGLTVQASARSPAVLMLMLTGVALGALAGTAASVGKAHTIAKQKIGMNRIVPLLNTRMRL
jgi:hypothetical protein